MNFSHTSQIHSLLTNKLKNTIKNNGSENDQNLPFLWNTWTPSNTPMPRPTQLIANKVLTGYNGMPDLPKLPLPWGNCQPQLPASSSYPANPPSQIVPDPISHFATVHQTVRQTDQPVLPAKRVA